MEETQKLDAEFWNLREKRRKLAGECVRRTDEGEALKKLRNEAEERTKVGRIRVKELEDKLKQANEELQFYKRRCEMFPVDSSGEGASLQQNLLNGLLASLVTKTEVVKTARAFLEENSKVEVCRGLLKMWDSLKPETQHVLSMTAQLQSLQKDKQPLTINLQRAEEEARELFEENRVLDEENKRLLKLCDSKTEQARSGDHSSDTTNNV